MATDPRRFDQIEKVVRDSRRNIDDVQSTLSARLAAHTHAAYVPAALVDAKGDLIAATAADTVARVAVGSDNQVVIADSAQSTGLRWGAVIPVVTSTGSISSPYTNQIILNTTDMLLYRYDGSSWVGFLAVGGTTATTRHEARYEQTTSVSLTTSTDTKLRFQTAVTTCDDVTPSGTGNQDFQLNRGGLWRVSAATRYNGNAGGGERHIFGQTGTVFNTANRFDSHAMVNVGSVPCTVTCSTDIRVTAGTSICFGGWQNCGATLGTDIGFGGTGHITMIWLRP